MGAGNDGRTLAYTLVVVLMAHVRLSAAHSAYDVGAVAAAAAAAAANHHVFGVREQVVDARPVTGAGHHRIVDGGHGGRGRLVPLVRGRLVGVVLASAVEHGVPEHGRLGGHHRVLVLT